MNARLPGQARPVRRTVWSAMAGGRQLSGMSARRGPGPGDAERVGVVVAGVRVLGVDAPEEDLVAGGDHDRAPGLASGSRPGSGPAVASRVVDGRRAVGVLHFGHEPAVGQWFAVLAIGEVSDDR